MATYCHDLTALSADAMVRQLQRALGDGVDYLDGGWSTLVRALTDTATAAGRRCGPGTPCSTSPEARVTGRSPPPTGPSSPGPS